MSEISTTRFLNPADTIQFRGTEYVIVKVNPKNYRIADRQGKQYNLDRRNKIEFLGRDYGWLSEVEQSIAKRQAEARTKGVDTSDESTGIRADGRPRFRAGQEVRITGRGAGRFEGKTGTIAKVNRTRYAVSIGGNDADRVLVPFGMTVLADASEVPQPAAQHPLIGQVFHYVMGDERVPFKVTEVDGKVLTAVGEPNGFEVGGKHYPGDHEGEVRDFLTAEVQQIIDFQEKWAKLSRQEQAKA